MDDNLVLEILRDIQSRLAGLEKRVETGFTEMRAGFSAMMCSRCIPTRTSKRG
jgi:hypothetical protein